VHRDKATTGFACCTAETRKGDQDVDKKTLENLRLQVEVLRRRNAALEAAGAGKKDYVNTGLPTTIRPSFAAKALPVAATAPSLSVQERSRLLQEATAEAIASLPLPIALLFPNQTPGLAGSLVPATVTRVPGAIRMLREAADITGSDLQEIAGIHGKTHQKSDAPRLGQPLVFVASCIAIERLRYERPEAVHRCQAVAGIGVGEFAALYAADVLDFDLGLRLVMLRAEQMQRAASAAGPELMQLSITGMSLERVQALCEQVRRTLGDDEVASVAYSVGAQAHICSGTKQGVEELRKLIEAQARAGARASVLPSPEHLRCGAFQTKLMEEAQRQLRKALLDALPKLRPPRCAVYFNVMGEAVPAGAQPSLIVQLLADQITSTVRWEQTVRTMLREGIEELVVCGPPGASQMKEVIEDIAPEAANRTTLCSA